jgi:PAS domain S-box-containing protein
MFSFISNTYRQALDSMADGVYLVSPDQKIQYWNRAAESLTGLSADEMIGKSFSDGNILYEDERGNPLQPFEYPASLCFQEKKDVSRNFFLKTKDNRKIPVEETASPLFHKGRIKGVIARIKDMTHCIEIVESRLRSERKERLIPICGWCKKIRSDENYWEQIETYLTKEGFGIFTHGMCPSCADKIFEKKVYLESYQQICKSISASISLDEVLTLIVTNVVKVMNVKASLLRLLNRDNKQLELAAYYGLSERYAHKGPVAYDASIDDALAGKPVSVYDITEHEDSKYHKEALEEGIRSILSIPLRYEKEVIGVLRMYTTEPVMYTEEDMKFITAIAEQAATAIVNARRYEKAVSREKEYLRVFEEITKTVSSSLQLKDVLDMIVKKIPQVMGLKGSSLRLLNRENKQLELAAYYGLSDKYANKGPVEYDASIDDALAGKAVSVYEIAERKDSKYYKEALEEGIRSILSIPMRFQNEVVGVLRLYTNKPVQYNEEDMRFMEAIAEQTSIAIVNAKHFESEISREKEYLRVFEEITKTVSSSLQLKDVLDMIVKKIPQVMGLKGSALRLVNKESKQLELVAHYGLSEKYVNKGPVEYDASIDDELAGTSVTTYDIEGHKDSKYYRETLEEGIKNILSVPLRFQNELIGRLRLYTGKSVRYHEADMRFMEAIAEQTAIAIVNAKHFETEISKEKEYLKVFQQVTKAVSSTLHVREVLDMIVRKIPEVMGLKAATIRLLDHTGKKLRLVAAHGLSEKYLNRGPVDTEENVIEALNEKPVAIFDVTTDPKIRYQKEAAAEGIKSILTLPIIARGKVLGILRLLTGQPRKFSQQEIDFSASLAEQCGTAIENATMYEKTRKEYDDMMQFLDGTFFEKE